MARNIPVILINTEPHILNKSKIDNPILKIVVPAMASVLIIGLLVYSFIISKPNTSKIVYSPSDVVYGEKVIAIHQMGRIILPAPVGQSNSDQTKEPSIQVSESFYDFGLVSSDQVLTRTFIIANTGTSPLIIQQSYTTCGCTTAEFSSNEIPSGKVVLMTLRFDPGFHKNNGSTVRRGVIIYTNDPQHPTQEIWIQASVK